MDKNEELNKKIQEAIKESLPSQIGDELKKLIEQGKADAQEVKSLIIACENNRKTIDELNTKLSEYRKLDDRNTAIEAREKAAEVAERKTEIEKLTYQLSSEKEKTEFSKSVALGLVRNIEYRRSLMDNTHEPCGKDQYGNAQYQNKTQNSNETTKAE